MKLDSSFVGMTYDITISGQKYTFLEKRKDEKDINRSDIIYNADLSEHRELFIPLRIA
jgi:hypothetical protein